MQAMITDVGFGQVHTNDPATSHHAAANPQYRLRWDSQRYRLLAEFSRGAHLTAEEAGRRADVGFYNERRRTSELKQQGLIEPTGKTRRNASGADAEVYRITPLGRRVFRSTPKR